MSESKYPVELKLEIVNAYKSGKGSYASLAEKYGIGSKSAKMDFVKGALTAGNISPC